jgi:glycosyltransferase involved in cell wall biosynthesis
MFTGRVTDAELRWLYANCAALVSSSFEDFGLTPVEAALFGKPSVLLRAGGFLDTTVEGTTGLFFDDPEPTVIRAAVADTLAANWSSDLIIKSAERFSQEGFARRLREIVSDVRGDTKLY